MDIIEDFEKSFFEIKTITDSISSKLDSEIDVLLDMKTMEKQAQDFLEKEWQDNTEKVIEKGIHFTVSS